MFTDVWPNIQSEYEDDYPNCTDLKQRRKKNGDKYKKAAVVFSFDRRIPAAVVVCVSNGRPLIPCIRYSLTDTPFVQENNDYRIEIHLS